MEPSEVLLLWVWAPFAVVFGVCLVAFRERVSRGIRENWLHRGMVVGPKTQSPVVVAAGGIVFAVAGVAVIVGFATGVLGGAPAV